MIFSYQKFTPKYNDKILNKAEAMKDCTEDFKIKNAPTTIDDSQLVTIGKFLQRHLVYSNIIWENNYRKKVNAVLEIDFILLDIDEKLSISDVQALNFKLMTVTTMSHTEEHNKFRVFIPLKTRITFESNQEYSNFMKLVNKKYFSDAADKSCLESGRAYITTPEAQYKLNNRTYLDIDSIFEEMKKLPTPNLKQLFSDINKEKKYTIDQVKNFSQTRGFASTFSKGNHYQPVYKIMGVCKISGLSNEDTVSLILDYNLPGEYGQYASLLKKAMLYDS